jgi:hypothetical protein
MDSQCHTLSSEAFRSYISYFSLPRMTVISSELCVHSGFHKDDAPERGSIKLFKPFAYFRHFPRFPVLKNLTTMTVFKMLIVCLLDNSCSTIGG